MKNCPILLHEHNEYLPVDIFLAGIEARRANFEDEQRLKTTIICAFLTGTLSDFHFLIQVL